jgi:hypothetical protein
VIFFALALFGLSIGSIITGLNSEDQEVPLVENDGMNSSDETGSTKLNFGELANSDTDQSKLTFTKGNVGFATAMGYSLLFIFITITSVAVSSFCYYMYKLNSEKFES